MEYINAFWVGGLICALVQILLEKTKLLPGRVMVLLVCTGAVLGSFGIYDKLIDFAGGRSKRSLIGIWEYLVPRSKKGNFRAWIFRDFYGWFYCQCGGNFRSADFFLCGKSDF